MKKSQLDKFNAADWGLMSPVLIRYCERVVKSKIWRSGAALPKGMEPPDILSVVIEKTLNAILEDADPEKERRNWNERANPELIDHLKGAIDSEIWNLLHLQEHALNNYSADANPEDAAEIFESQVNNSRPFEVEIDEGVEYEERLKDDLFDVFMGSLSGVIKDDLPAIRLLDAYRKLANTQEVVKPQDAADLLNVDIEEVRNIVRRLRRAANNVKLKLKAEVTCE